MAEEEKVEKEVTKEKEQETKEEIKEEIKEEEVKEEVKEEVEKKQDEISGDRDVAKNDVGIAVAKNTNVEKEKEVNPCFFVDSEEKYRIDVDILYDKKTGKILSVSRTGLGVDFSKFHFLGHITEWVEFTQPTYDDIANYRRAASSFNIDAERILVDPISLRNSLIIWHLKGWSLKDKEGNKVELEINESGSLVEDSLKSVYNLFPTFVDVIMTLFENEVLLRS